MGLEENKIVDIETWAHHNFKIYVATIVENGVNQPS